MTTAATKQQRIVPPPPSGKNVSIEQAFRKLLSEKSDGRVTTINPTKIFESDFDVRENNKESEEGRERVEMFMSVWQNTPDLIPPLLVEITTETHVSQEGTVIPIGSFVIIDGRNRHRAALEANIAGVRCILLMDLTPMDRYVISMASNMGGSLPPTKQDYKKCALELLQQDYAQEEIRDRWSPFVTKTLLNNTIKWAAAHFANLRDRAIRELAADGVDQPTIAKKYNITVAEVKDAIRGCKPRGSKQADPSGIPGNVATTTTKYRDYLTRTIKKYRGLYDDEDVDVADVNEFFTKLETHAVSIVRTIETAKSKWGKHARLGQE